MCAKNRGERMCPAVSRRLRLPHAGPTSRTIAGVRIPGPNQPTPKPSPSAASLGTAGGRQSTGQVWTGALRCM